MRVENIDGQLWAKLVIASSRYLESRKTTVDALNVFPVPDGDTGTNMSLTMASAARSVQQKNEANVGNVTKLVANGALMGARGNSGVILSQLLAGFAKRVDSLEVLDAQSLSEALDSAVDTAYKAVMNPVEGTILTVSKEAALAARKMCEKGPCTIEVVLEEAYRGAVSALEETPEMLPILKQAGVVDAGGQGFVYILEGMLRSLRGEEFFEKTTGDMISPQNIKKSALIQENLEYQYCTEFIVKKKDKDIDMEEIRGFLQDKGDCILVVGNPTTCKIHVHTNYPGKILDYCTPLGTLHQIDINNMSEQSEEMQAKVQTPKVLGIIGVTMGAGLIEIFKSLGVDVVITGGQTMNPSTQDFVEAIGSIMAQEVLILPNNSNVIMAAKQAASVATKPVEVVETKNIPQGIAALMSFNPEHDISHNKKKMEEASKHIVSLEVTYAVRDALYEEHNIKQGQVLGIVDNKLTQIGDEIQEVVEKLVAQKISDNHELVTIYYGDDVTEEEAKGLVENLSEKYGQLDFELHLGGQPLYYYLLSME